MNVGPQMALLLFYKLKTVIKFLKSAITSVLVSYSKANKSEYAVEWFLHYLFGNGEEKTIPSSFVEEDRNNLLHSIVEGYFQGYCTNLVETAYREGGYNFSKQWYWCVGAYSYTIEHLLCGGIKVKCSDLYDFHHDAIWGFDFEGLGISPRLMGIFGKLLPKMGIQVQGTSLEFHETALVKLGNPFLTKWEYTFSLRDLEGVCLCYERANTKECYRDFGGFAKPVEIYKVGDDYLKVLITEGPWARAIDLPEEEDYRDDWEEYEDDEIDYLD